MTQLWEEFSAATHAVERRHFDFLARHGVPATFLWRGPMRFGVGEIAASSAGTYQPTAGGRRAIIVPAVPLRSLFECVEGDDLEDLGDLIAWHPDDPTRWWSRTGAVPMMNPGAVIASEIYCEPLKVWSSPLAWMRASGDGIVVLDPRANLRFWIGSAVPQLICETVELGNDISRRLREPEPRLPQILVPNTSKAAA